MELAEEEAEEEAEVEIEVEEEEEEEEEESEPVLRFWFNLTRDSKVSTSYVERTMLLSPRILTQENQSITKNV